MLDFGRASNGLPYIRTGEGALRAALLFGASALFEPLDRSRQIARYAAIARELLPGFAITIYGYHEQPPVPYTLDTIVADIAQAIRETSGAPDLVVGLSFGGFVALRLAAACPDLVHRLVLLSSAHNFSLAGWEKVHRQHDALEAGDVASLVFENALLFRRPWLNLMVGARLAWEGRVRITARLNNAAMLARGYRTLFGETFDRTSIIARRVRAPTLVLGGTADQYFDSRLFEETAQLVPTGSAVLFAGETHMLVLERRRSVCNAIARFAGVESLARVGRPVPS